MILAVFCLFVVNKSKYFYLFRKKYPNTIILTKNNRNLWIITMRIANRLLIFDFCGIT